MPRRWIRLKPGDERLVLPLMRRFYALFGYPFSVRRQGASLRRLLADPGIGQAWLLQVGGEAAGYAVLVSSWSIEYGGRVALLDELFVEEKFQGMGHGTWMLRRLRAEARKLGVRRLFLEVEADNRRGYALYRRLGFRDPRRRLLNRPV